MKAITTSSTLELAKPAKALAGIDRARVRTAAATASIAAVRSGNAFRMTERSPRRRWRTGARPRRQPGRNRREPDAERHGERQALLDQRAASKIEGGHWTGPPAGGAEPVAFTRARPFRPVARPLTAPSSAASTYCHWNSYSPGDPGVAPGPAEERAGDAVAGADPLALELAEDPGRHAHRSTRRGQPSRSGCP